jgi:hypothetical protein
MSSSRAKKFNREISRDDLYYSRLSHSLSLRKTYIDDFLFKKRFTENEENVENEGFLLKSEEENGSDLQIYREILTINISLSEINYYSNLVFSSDRTEFLTGIVSLRKTLSSQNNPPVKLLVENGVASQVIRKLEQFIQQEIQDNQYAKFVINESLWILCNISCVYGYDVFLYQENILYVIQEIFTKINCREIISQAIWLVANLAAEEKKFIQSEMIKLDFLSFLVKFLKIKDFKMETCFWAISNILRDFGSLSLPISNIHDEIQEIVLFSSNKVKYFRDYISCHVSTKLSDSIPMYAINILKSLSEKFTCLIDEYLIKENIIEPLIQLLKLSYQVKNQFCFLLILKLIGNYSTSTNGTCHILSSDILSILQEILTSKLNEEILKETCFILSNIIAGSSENIKLFFNQEGLLETVFKLAQMGSNKTKKEAIWCLCCLSADLNKHHLKKLLDLEFMAILAEGITMKDKNLIHVCLEALDIIFSVKENNRDEKLSRKIHYEIVKEDIKYKLEALHSKTSLISQKSSDLLFNHFSNEYELKLQEDLKEYLDYNKIEEVEGFHYNDKSDENSLTPLARENLFKK